MMQHILTVKTELRELFQIRFSKIQLMKLLEIVTMMDQRALASMVYKFCDKKTRSGIRVNEELANELHKPLIKKINRRKVYKRFKDNIWAADLADMESLPTKNESAKYLLCVVDVFNKMKGLNL